jgi:hypothetical protein
MSDDGLQIYFAGKFGVKYLDSIPWETDQFTSAVKEIIVKKGKRQPIIILNDMVEQHYRKERVPNVSIFDRASVIQRRLSIAFPSHKVRAALKLKHKTPEDKKGGGAPYLFAAIPNSSAYRLTIQSVELSAAPVEGLYLLPVESSVVAKLLSLKLSKKDKQQTTWTIFAGQHHNGGLRQIVTREGELALTRMTPIVDTDVEPALWAKEVSGELNATMSYLSRFGYRETDGLRVIVIANETASEHLEMLNNANGEFDVMTANQAASLLGVNIGGQAEGRYADPLHVAFLSKLSKFQLPMKSQALERLSTPRKLASVILLGLFIACLYFGFFAFQSLKESSSLNDRLTVAHQQRQTLEEEYKRELEIKKELGFDFALVNNSLEVFEEMQRQKMKPLPIMREIGVALGTDIHLDNLSIKLDEVETTIEADLNDPNSVEEKQINHFMDMVLTISFPSSIEPDLGVQRINRLQQRLLNTLPPEFSVEVTRQVADLSYTGNFVAGEDEEEPEDYIAEMVIRGLVK